ncbi:MAG TPA: magnesium transporter [Chloroflexota bacterium]|nr:magnesium transporter [Chloroflexota bacterium]
MNVNVRPTDTRDAELATLGALPREELAQKLTDLRPLDLSELFQRIGDDGLAELVAELDPFDAARLLRKLSQSQAADVLEEMAPDDAADVVDELDPIAAEAILVAMDPDEAQELRELLTFESGSAGGIMTPEFLAVRPDVTAERALVGLRQLAGTTEQIYYTYVVEPDARRLLGVLSLRNLVLSSPTALVRDLMVTDVVKVHVDADQEDAARLLDQHHLIALPVVDSADRLVGIITADDAAAVLLEEAGEDLERMGGSQPLEEPYLRASVAHLFRKRIGWLLVLFVAEAYTGSVLRFYEDTLSEQIALAFFIPLLIGTGGNTGSQTVSTLIRAMAVGEVGFQDILKVLRREAAVGALLGLVMGAATYVRAWTLGVGIDVGPVVAMTATSVVIWAALVAAVLPLILRKLRVDPAVVSAPLITTLVDGTGLIIYFTVARLLLHLD